jgi:hypothetical protein
LLEKSETPYFRHQTVIFCVKKLRQTGVFQGRFVQDEGKYASKPHTKP